MLLRLLARTCLLAAPLIARPDADDAALRALAARADIAPLVRIVPVAPGLGTGSGVLLAGGIVLTAAHVVDRLVADSVRVRAGDALYAVREIAVHPAWRRGAPDAVDLAIVRLIRVPDHPVARLVASAPVLPARTIVAGYGLGGPTRVDSAGTARAGENRLDRRGGVMPGAARDDLLVGDFDLPGHGDRNATGDSLALPLEVLPSGGDSGGPLYAEEQGEWRLLAIYSHTAYRLDTWRGGQPTYAGSRFAATDLTRHRAWLAAHGIPVPASREVP